MKAAPAPLEPGRQEADAARLIEALTPQGALAERSRHLVLIGPGQGPFGAQIIASDDASAIAEHVRAARTARANAFWTVNPVLEGWSGPKPSKAAIAAVAALMIDLDAPKPPKGAGAAEKEAHWAAQRARMLDLGQRIAQVPTYRPTAVVFTGNGLQLHYRMANPLGGDDAAAADAIERAWHDEVLAPLGADHTQNRDRLARLPGPNLKPDRPPAEARLIDADASRTLGRDDFAGICEALLAVPGWPEPRESSKRKAARSAAAPGDSGEEAEVKRCMDVLRPRLGELRGVDRNNLSAGARKLLLGSRTILARLEGDDSGLDDGSGSGFLQSIAGAARKAGGSIGEFAELAYACDDAHAHLNKQPGDALELRALARAYVRAAPDAAHGLGQSKRAGLDENQLAREFAARHEGQFLHDHGRRCWRAWTGDRWKEDETGAAVEACRGLAEELAQAGGRSRSSISWNRIKGALTLATTDPRLAAVKDCFDRDPYLLGAPGVTIDLRTGQERVPDPADRITRQTAAAPGDGIPRRWLRFLLFATGRDKGVVRFLQRWAGYAATGDTKAQMFLFICGDGGTGKSVFLNTLHRLLGDYAQAPRPFLCGSTPQGDR